MRQARRIVALARRRRPEEFAHAKRVLLVKTYSGQILRISPNHKIEELCEKRCTIFSSVLQPIVRDFLANRCETLLALGGLRGEPRRGSSGLGACFVRLIVCGKEL